MSCADQVVSIESRGETEACDGEAQHTFHVPQRGSLRAAIPRHGALVFDSGFCTVDGAMFASPWECARSNGPPMTRRLVEGEGDEERGGGGGVGGETGGKGGGKGRGKEREKRRQVATLDGEAVYEWHNAHEARGTPGDAWAAFIRKWSTCSPDDAGPIETALAILTRCASVLKEARSQALRRRDRAIDRVAQEVAMRRRMGGGRRMSRERGEGGGGRGGGGGTNGEESRNERSGSSVTVLSDGRMFVTRADGSATMCESLVDAPGADRDDESGPPRYFKLRADGSVHETVGSSHVSAVPGGAFSQTEDGVVQMELDGEGNLEVRESAAALWRGGFEAAERAVLRAGPEGDCTLSAEIGVTPGSVVRVRVDASGIAVVEFPARPTFGAGLDPGKTTVVITNRASWRVTGPETEERAVDEFIAWGACAEETKAEEEEERGSLRGWGGGWGGWGGPGTPEGIGTLEERSGERGGERANCDDEDDLAQVQAQAPSSVKKIA